MRRLIGYATLALSMIVSMLASAADDRGTGRSAAAQPSATSNQEASTMKVGLTIDGKSITATLTDNASSRDFMAMLPLTLTDYASTEKIAYLPRKLSTADAPAGADPAIGDITYYAPWGNLAIFYRDAPYAQGRVKLGRISGIEALGVRGSRKATIEQVGK